MMTPSSPAAQFDLGTVRSPVDNEPLARRFVVAAVIGLAVGVAFLAVIPRVPDIVHVAWCVGNAGPACDPGSLVSGQLVDAVVWAAVLGGTATLVSAPLGWLAAALGRVRVALVSVLLGPPLVWTVAVLGQPFGVTLDRMRSPWILLQAPLAYLLAAGLTATGPRPLYRWLAAAALLVATAIVIVFGYRYD